MTINTCDDFDDNPEWDAEFGNDARERRALANMLTAQNPEWQAKVKAKNQAQAQDPEWRARHKAATQTTEWLAKNKARAGALSESAEFRERQKAMAQTAEWQARHQAAVERRDANTEWRDKLSDAIKQKHQDPEYQAKQRAAHYKPFHSPDGDFASIGAAIEASGVSAPAFRKRMKKFPDEYYYLPKPTE